MKTPASLPSQQRHSAEQRHARSALRARQAGVTLVESLMVLAVTVVVLGAAVPSFEAAREKRQLEGVAAQLETDIHHARSLAVARSTTLRITFQDNTAGSCYVVHSGNAGDCTCAADGSAACRPGAKSFQAVHWPAGGPVRVVSNSRSLVFDEVRGTVSPTATVRVQGRQHAIHQVVNIMGRVRSCSPSALPGYKAC
ncbi:MAG TPA: GspH/FimT family pseudopilin [Rubrivivax sp.]|nr:GspH/FimT family pseudopilin [Rubrivivax sp.]